MTMLTEGTFILNLFDAFLIIFGIYTIFTSLNMKKTGILANWLVGNTEIDKCRDTKGFIEYIYRKTIVFGILMAIYGCFSLTNTFIMKLKYVESFGVVFFLVVIGWFAFILKKGKNQFFY